jgi:hypothetical protein
LQRARFFAQTRDRDDLMGNFSRTYEYRGKSDVRYVASCDFPYSGGWHELTVCYRGLGWHLHNRRVETKIRDADGAPWQFMEASFSKPDGGYGYLMASAFDEAGRPIDLPTNSIVEDALTALMSRGKSNHNGLTFQVQVWTTAGIPISEVDREATRQLFLAAREHFFRHVAQSENQPPTRPAIAAQ